MKGQFKVSGNLVLEVEAESSKDMFGKLAEMQEVFGEKKCGLCESTNLKFAVRKATSGKKEFTYYELHCNDCFARLSFGQSQDTKSIYPKRRLDKDGVPTPPGDESGKYGKHNGWTQYKGPTKGEE